MDPIVIVDIDFCFFFWYNSLWSHISYFHTVLHFSAPLVVVVVVVLVVLVDFHHHYLQSKCQLQI